MEKNMISFYGMKPSRALIKQVQGRIEKWISREQGWLYFGKDWHYSMEIEQVGSPHLYQCTLTIQTQDKEWTSQGTGKALQDAITHVLKNLQGELTSKPIHVTLSYA